MLERISSSTPIKAAVAALLLTMPILPDAGCGGGLSDACQSLKDKNLACCADFPPAQRDSCVSTTEATDYGKLTEESCKGSLAITQCSGGGGMGGGGVGGGGGAGGSGAGGAGGGGGSPGGCAPHCGWIISDGGEVCSGTPGYPLWMDLLSCAVSQCGNDCPTFVMDHGLPDSDPNCPSCLVSSCQAQFNACSDDI